MHDEGDSGHWAATRCRSVLVCKQRMGPLSHLQLLICHVLAQLLGHPLQVLEADLASLIVIEQLESLRLQAETWTQDRSGLQAGQGSPTQYNTANSSS